MDSINTQPITQKNFIYVKKSRENYQENINSTQPAQESQLNQIVDQNNQVNTGDIYTNFPNRIKRANQGFADEVYHIIDNNLKYIPYERKQLLINAIEDLKQFQEKNNLVNLKEDTKSYFGNGVVKNRDQIDFIEESYIKSRNVKNYDIQQFITYKQQLQERYNQKVDQWGYRYDKNKKNILTLPALFKYNEISKSYKLQGQLCKQIQNYVQKNKFEEEIENLVTHLSNHLKIVHNNYKNMQYENSLFQDTKYYVNFEKEIHAIISIKQVTISPFQIYEGPIHKEGLSVEVILIKNYQEAFIKFQFGQSNVKNRNLKNNQNTMQQMYPKNEDQNIQLGKTDLQEDMMIIFPNCNEHQVSFKNLTNKVLSRTVITIQIVNHIDQPFTTNDYHFNFNQTDKVNKIPYNEKRRIPQEKEDNQSNIFQQPGQIFYVD